MINSGEAVADLVVEEFDIQIDSVVDKTSARADSDIDNNESVIRDFKMLDCWVELLSISSLINIPLLTIESLHSLRLIVG